MSSSSHHFSLRWNDYNRHISLAFDALRSQEDLVDVTLSCEGRKIRAHKILLSACSTYFREVFKENPCQHPVIIFKNVKFDDLTAIIEFMYQGEVSVMQDSLPSFLHTAELLAVQGLTESKDFVPQNETIQVPKHAKLFPVAVQSSSAAMVEIPRPVIKKQKLSSANHRQMNLNIHEEHDEFIESVADSSDSPTMPEDDQEMEMKPFRFTSNHTTSTTNIHIQTEDEQYLPDEERDDKSYIPHETYEIVHESSDHRSNHEMDEDVKHQIQTVEMSRIFTTKSGESSKMHDGELKFRCSICWKGFKHPNSLTLHKDMHNGKTKCPVCNRAFSRSYDMKTHMTKIHKITLSVETKFNLGEAPSHSPKFMMGETPSPKFNLGEAPVHSPKFHVVEAPVHSPKFHMGEAPPPKFHINMGEASSQ